MNIQIDYYDDGRPKSVFITDDAGRHHSFMRTDDAANRALKAAQDARDMALSRTACTGAYSCKAYEHNDSCFGALLGTKT